MRVLQRTIDLAALRAHDRSPLGDELLDRLGGETVPDFETTRVDADRGVHCVRFGQPPVPEILVLDVREQAGEFRVGVEVLPREHRTGLRQIEVHDMTALAEIERQLGIGLEAFERRHVMIEHDDAGRLLAERAQQAVRERNVREHHLGAHQFLELERVVVTARAVLSRLAPGPPHRPGGAEAIGAASVVETDFFHGAGSLAAQVILRAQWCASERSSEVWRLNARFDSA